MDRAGPVRTERPWPFRPVSDRSLAGLYAQLAWMLESGISVTEALRHLTRQGRGRLARTLDRMRAAVESGNSLAGALAACPEVFPGHVRALAEAGEQSGSLPDVFRGLAADLELRLDLRLRIIQACIYPFILFTLVFFLLPLSRLFLQGWGAYLRESLVPYLVAVGVLFVALVPFPWVLRRLLGRARWQRVVGLLPFFGTLQTLRTRLRFSRQMAVALGAGMEMFTALDLAARSSGSLLLVERVGEAGRTLREGGTLEQALARTRCFDEELMRTVAAGEASGRLEEGFSQVARSIERSFLHRLEVGVKLLSVLILLAVYVYGMWRVYQEYQNIWSSTRQQLDGVLDGIGGGKGGDLDQLLKELGGKGGNMDQLLRGMGRMPPELQEALR